MFKAIEKNLIVGMDLVRSLSDAQYQDNSVPPYHSSIGGHIRHILDIFDCIFCGIDTGLVDLAARSRDLTVEQDRDVALAYFERTLHQLRAIQNLDMNQLIDVADDLGNGEVVCKYTLAAALVQAHSHAMHHFASLGYIISKLGLELPNTEFGYNPTTPDVSRMN